MLGENEYVSSYATVYFHRCACFTSVYLCVHKTASGVSEADDLSSTCLLVGRSSFQLFLIEKMKVAYPENEPTFLLIYISKARMMHQQRDERETLTATEAAILIYIALECASFR